LKILSTFRIDYHKSFSFLMITFTKIKIAKIKEDGFKKSECDYYKMRGMLFGPLILGK